MITRAQAEALAAAAIRCRPAGAPTWDHAGTVAQIAAAGSLGSPADIGAALMRLAGDSDQRTPGMLPLPGPHWAGTTVGARKPPTMCGEHPARRALDCPECAETASADPTEGAAAVRAALREAPRYTDPAVIAARQAEHRIPDLAAAFSAVVAARQAEHRRLAVELAELRGEGA